MVPQTLVVKPTSPTLLTTWDIWNERNAPIFRNKHALASIIFYKINKKRVLSVYDIF
jgi:hypothetical protein